MSKPEVETIYTMDSEAYDAMRSGIDQLKAENAKLRELVAEIYPYAKAYLQKWRMVGGIDSKSHDWYLRLLELGVEVSE